MRFRLEIVQNIKLFNDVFNGGAIPWVCRVPGVNCTVQLLFHRGGREIHVFHVHLLLSRIDKLDYYNKINPSRNKTNDDAI